MEDIYLKYLHGCSNHGDRFCEPVMTAVEDAKKEAREHMESKESQNKTDKS